MTRDLTPRQVSAELDRHIVGQADAKRAVAIALRNRWRRMQLPEGLRREVTPRNILMIGPTGVGKTEIARRLAVLAEAPFVKVEATKFTEVGYVGRDVDSIIRDLAAKARTMARDEFRSKHAEQARQRAEEQIIDQLMLNPPAVTENEPVSAAPRDELLARLRAGVLDDTEVEVEEIVEPAFQVETIPGMEALAEQMSKVFKQNSEKRRVKLSVRRALEVLENQFADAMVDDEQITQRAIALTEENGIVFIDEIDKVAMAREGVRGADVSREGVQRDLLPLIEGSVVNTPLGPIRTDHILFIASGAFHYANPSDLVPELQGRLPIRVELQALTVEDFQRILVEPEYSLVEQYRQLLQVDGAEISLTEDAIERLAEIAWDINQKSENIGARRLHTVMEKLFEDLSYSLPQDAAQDDGKVEVDKAFVEKYLGELDGDADLKRFIL